MSLRDSAFFISERGDDLNESIELTVNKRIFQKNEGEKHMSTAINLNELMKLYEGGDVEITLIIPSSPPDCGCGRAIRNHERERKAQ